MKISARNQFEGRITGLTSGPVNAEVRLALSDGDTLVAVVTQGNVAALGLAIGGVATAIVKAPWVIVTAGDPAAGPRFSACNQLAGVVSAVSAGPVNADVAINLPGGRVVHAVITRSAVAELGLAVGAPACAVIQASHVVLAVQ